MYRYSLFNLKDRRIILFHLLYLAKVGRADERHYLVVHSKESVMCSLQTTHTFHQIINLICKDELKDYFRRS